MGMGRFRNGGFMYRKAMIMDGNQAAAHVAYAYSEAAAIYPITPASPMSELADEWMSGNRKNIFGSVPLITEMQSEAGAAGAVHGALAAGALATTFTSSQGLLLMIPNLYRIAGELLPGVFHVAARTIATHALSIFGDHSDIYACRQTGVAMLAHSSVQEVMDLSPIAHLSALQGRVPFLNFFDGFRTSHELNKIQVWDYEQLAGFTDHNALKAFRDHCLHPTHARIMGSAQNPDIYFQAREACNRYYDALPGIVEENMAQINKAIGTSYGLFDYYGAPDAEHVIVAMGSVCETIREYLDAFPQQKYGLVVVRLYRPFSARHLLEALPSGVKRITVLNRTKEPGAPGEPLYLDVLSALWGTAYQGVSLFSGRYGLSSKDTTPEQIGAVYANHTKTSFTIGIEDDVTCLSLKASPGTDTTPKGVFACKFWGLGGDGTVSATKNIVKIVGNHSEQNVQGYFEYDSKKSRGLTISHLRFSPLPIHSSYLIRKADFVACHNPVYLHKYNMVQELKDGGSFLLNCYYKERSLEEYIPLPVLEYMRQHRIQLYVIDAITICKEIGLNNKISTILQAAFFRVAKLLPLEEAGRLMKEAAFKSYGKMGEKIMEMNYAAIDRGLSQVHRVELEELKMPTNRFRAHGTPTIAMPEQAVQGNAVPVQTAPDYTLPDNPVFPDYPELLSYVEKLQQPITDQRGDALPVSAFLPYADGYTPPGSTAHERRNVATEVPVWIPENCIQCNRCSYVCPHAVIRPAVVSSQELENAPQGMKSIPMMGVEEHSFAITISDVDCTGCGSCVGVCPGKMGNKALRMCPIHEHEEQQEVFDYCKPLPAKEAALSKFPLGTVKGSQLRRPLMEFSGACAGCGETPYVKLLTQLFGDKMYIANATGCSSIWANSSPSTAYTLNEQGHGPAWSNSLFEDAAEFGFGMLMAQTLRQDNTIQWVIGGDGWAYDIGFGGLDHILASGRNINVLVLDTEVYSNTGGQASKATPLGSTAKFVSGGKSTRKKDLASIAMTYGDVYVAQVAMGANFEQTVKAFSEAAAYDGPSLIIAYATCIAHGIRSGLGSTPHEEKKAVDAGYFHLFRYHPGLAAEGKNPFILDSREPTVQYEDFLSNEIRYNILSDQHPQQAEILFAKAARLGKERYQYLKRLEELYKPAL